MDNGLTNKQLGCAIVTVIAVGVTIFVLQWAVIASILMVAYRAIVG